ncbi:MAG TPA: response regulator [Pyrinomonadaceae bacterium]|nr:response regulator [Pyrinomonadaceae bacterium]
MPDEKDARPVVLLVDDFDDSRESIAIQLRAEGFDVIEAPDGLAAIEAARRKRPSLVLMDLSLPGLDGLSATCRLRELEGMREVPVVALTAHSPETHRDAALAVGCDEFLTKPVEPKSLTPLLRRLLAEGRAPARPQIDSASLADDQLAEAIERFMPGRGDSH